MTHKKLGLLLLPLVPLSAIGIVEIANTFVAPEPVAVKQELCPGSADLRLPPQPAPPPVVAEPTPPQPAPSK